jgi:hypothetical protein
MLFVAIENQNSARKSRCCQPELLAIADVDWTRKKVIHGKHLIKKKGRLTDLAMGFALC